MNSKIIFVSNERIEHLVLAMTLSITVIEFMSRLLEESLLCAFPLSTDCEQIRTLDGRVSGNATLRGSGV